eukprot:1160360-Pelagomonas_calceolata.AAC.7
MQVPNIFFRKLATGPVGCSSAAFSHDGMILALAASESSTLGNNVFKILLYRCGSHGAIIQAFWFSLEKLSRILLDRSSALEGMG